MVVEVIKARSNCVEDNDDSRLERKTSPGFVSVDPGELVTYYWSGRYHQRV